MPEQTGSVVVVAANGGFRFAVPRFIISYFMSQVVWIDD